VDSPDAPDATPQPDQNESLRPIIVQTAVVTAILVALIAVGSVFLRGPLEWFANWVVTELGLFGVFFGVLATDIFTIPIPPDAYLFVVVASDGPVAAILAVCCAGSIIAGSLAYKLGPYIQRLPFLRSRLEHFRSRGERLFLKYGVWTVVIAALSPIPFSITCWLAGIYKMPYRSFFFATFARIPRLLGYYALFVLGWTVA
jgi:membrane protein YqaA with SNARE-associated domain